MQLPKCGKIGWKELTEWIKNTSFLFCFQDGIPVLLNVLPGHLTPKEGKGMLSHQKNTDYYYLDIIYQEWKIVNCIMILTLLKKK